MNACSLVGRTQGARKRAARAYAFYGRAATTRKERREVSTGWAILTAPGSEAARHLRLTYRQESRPKYRIGERLRLCPPGGCGGTGVVDDIGIDAVCPLCNGSGVFPARKARR